MKSHDGPTISVGDLVQVFMKQGHDKRGQWSSAKPILSYDHSTRTASLLVSNGRKMSAAVEDVRPALCESPLAEAVQQAIDGLDVTIDNAIVEIPDNVDSADAPRRSADEPFQMSETDRSVATSVGESIEIYWPGDTQYYSGRTFLA